MTDYINHNSIKLTRAVNTLFAFTRDAYQTEFGNDASHKREFCRRVAEKYAELVDCKVVDPATTVFADKQQLSEFATKQSRRETGKPEISYAIGIEHSPNEFGMTHGPTAFLRDMLAVDPPDEKAKIIKFTATGNRRFDPQTDVVYEAKDGVWQPATKSRAKIPTANPLVTKATELAEQIIELAESSDLPSAGIDYAESVADKARNILESVESENRATSGQIEALQNMLDGLERWFRD